MNFEVDMDKIKAYLESLNEPVKCPLCGNSGLNVYPSVVYGASDYFTNNGDTVMPLLPIICPNCGYTAFINPYFKGLLKNHESVGEQNAS